MTAPTESPAPEAQPAPQGSHFWLITVQTAQNHRGDVNYATFHGSISPGRTQSRQDVYEQLRQHIAAQVGERFNVLHFSLEPNQL
ncbi:hypothetical protein ACWGCW_00855 [Streptomyces sp. NPDC054933]